jgi:hypothetical protein
LELRKAERLRLSGVVVSHPNVTFSQSRRGEIS